MFLASFHHIKPFKALQREVTGAECISQGANTMSDTTEKVKNPQRIKNITIAAHVDSGKTTITEEILALSGAVRSRGRVDHGTAHTDTLQIEKARGISVKSAHASFVWKDTKFNLIDTPGHTDFSSEVDRTLSVSDGLILALSSVEGIQAHTESIFNSAKRLSLPTIIFINKIDRSLSDFSKVLEDLKYTFDGKFVPLNLPVNEGSPDFGIEKPSFLRDNLCDELSLFHDSLAEKLLEGEEPTREEILASLIISVRKREIFPVLCGSALASLGIEELLDAALALLPFSDEVKSDEDLAVVFGIEHDKTLGRIAHIRTYGKALFSRETLVYRDGERESEKISQIRTFVGTKSIDATSVGKGDIAAVCGLSSSRLYDMFGEGAGSLFSSIANPYLSVKVISDGKATAPELLSAFRELEAENPLLSVKWENEKRELLISITGKLQTEVLALTVKERYGFDISFSEPSVIYKETPSKSAYGFEAYTMPKPCWAVVRLLVEPLQTGSGVVFDMGNVPHNKLFYKYQEHIRRSFYESLEQGIMGWEVTDIKTTLVDGEHHTIHTHPLDFFVATPMAFMNALASSGTTLLEPMLSVRITLPSEYLGRVMSDIVSMRGEFEPAVTRKDISVIECLLPVSESMEYPLAITKMTSGKAVYSPKFAGYRPLHGVRIETARRGINPLDRAKWILHKRGAIQ